MEFKKQNLDISDVIVTTYWDYIKLRDVNTKHFLMIAELIDNAISSFDNHYGDKWDEELTIDIKLGFGDSTLRFFNDKDLEVIENSYISVHDNAFGMSVDELKEAVKLNRKVASNSKMNVHGRGLKQCAFYFGTDLTVKTFDKSGLHAEIDIKLSQQDDIDNWIVLKPIVDSSIKGRGTEILIENIYVNKQISEATWKRIVTALEYRYIRYITSNKNKMSIKYTYKFNNDTAIDYKYFVKPEEPKVFLKQVFEVLNKDDKQIDEFISETYKKVRTTLDIAASKLDTEVAEIAFEKIKLLLLKTKLNSQTIFEFDMTFKYESKSMNFLFWMLPRNHASYRGIRIFEGERAINHAGYQEFETKPYMDWKKDKTKGTIRMDTGSTENVFAGSCDYSELGLSSKTDKSTFTIDEDLESEINKFILTVWTVFNRFVLNARRETKFDKGIKPTKIEKTDLATMAKTKFPNENISYVEHEKLTKDDYQVFEYNTKNNVVWTIKIKTDEVRFPRSLFEKDVQFEEFSITVYTAHPFWRNMDGYASFYVETLIPITLMVAIQFIESQSSSGNLDTIDLLNRSSDIYNESGNF